MNHLVYTTLFNDRQNDGNVLTLTQIVPSAPPFNTRYQKVQLFEDTIKVRFFIPFSSI